MLGSIAPDGYLVKSGKQVTLFNKFDGFGVSKVLFSIPEIAGVEIRYKNKRYRASTETYLEHGIHVQFGQYEEQIILPRSKFDDIK